MTERKFLTEDEIIVLINKSKKGDDLATLKIINNFEIIVNKLVYEMYTKCDNKNIIEIEDLKQIANISLIKSIRNFNSELGNKFITFAYLNLVGNLKSFIDSNDKYFKISRTTKCKIYKIKQVEKDLTDKLLRSPTPEEISNVINISPKIIDRIIKFSSINFISLDSEVTGGSEDASITCFEEIVTNINYNENDNLNKLALKLALQELNDEEKDIIKKRFFEEKTQEEVAKTYDVIQATISIREKRVLNKLRKLISDKKY